MQPLSSIAERGSASGEDSDEEEEEEGGWKSAGIEGRPRDSMEESVIKSGYLWKKGERRKVLHYFAIHPSAGDPYFYACRHGRNDGSSCDQHI